MPQQKLPVQNLDDINQRRRARELTNSILSHDHDDSRVQTPKEIAAGVTPINKAYAPGDVRRYGAVLDGVTNDTAALQRWASIGGEHTFPEGTALISAAIALESNSTYAFAEGAVITTATHDISHFTAASKTNIKISGGKFLRTSAGAAAYFAAIAFDTCTNCVVSGTEFEGMQWAGVWVLSCEHCTVEKSYFHDWLGTVQDAANVAIMGFSNFNIVRDNRFYGGGWHGCLIQGEGGGRCPTNNLVAGNRIGPHTAYGIARYNINGGNSYDTIDSNVIEGITGVNPGGGGGAGIYIQNSGAVTVSNNNIRNCCTATSAAGLTPAGIGIVNINSPFDVTLTGAPTAGATSGTLTSAWTPVSGTYNVLFVETAGGAIEIRVATLTNGSTAITWVNGLTNNCNAAATTRGLIPPTVVGNTISDIAHDNTAAVTMAGINVSSSTSGALISGNTISQGAGSVAGISGNVGIFVSAAHNVVIQGNRIFLDPSISSGAGIFLYANGADINNFTVTGNVIQGCSSSGLRTTSNASFAVNRLRVTGNTHEGGGSGCVSYFFEIANDCVVSGNLGKTTTVQAAYIISSLRMQLAGNSFVSSGVDAVITSGTCTGSYFDKSNYVSGSGGANIDAIQNAATGLIVEQLGSAAPAANNRAVGDRVEQSVPVVGNPKGWRTTVAGAPGTSVSEGVL